MKRRVSKNIAIILFILSNNIQLKEKFALLYVTLSDKYRHQYNDVRNKNYET